MIILIPRNLCERLNFGKPGLINSFVFTCSTGRCGTGYLAYLFDAQHEPKPKLMQAGNNELSNFIRDVAGNGNATLAEEFLTKVKLPYIERTWKKDVYLETAHTVSKGFLVPLINILKGRLKVVRLRRSPTKVVKPVQARNQIPAGVASKNPPPPLSAKIYPLLSRLNA